MTFRPLIAATMTLGVVCSPSFADPSWQGFYGGLSLNSNDTKGGVTGNSTHKHDNTDVSLGGYVGYNYALQGTRFVWGPELALSGLGGDGKTITSSGKGTSTLESGTQLSARLRGGYTFDNLFVYGLAGITGTEGGIRETSDTDTDIILAGTWGVGAEWKLNNEWSTRIDATHTEYDAKTYDFSGATHKVDFDVRQISIGLTKRF